jgi:hypothetical protein
MGLVVQRNNAIPTPDQYLKVLSVPGLKGA